MYDVIPSPEIFIEGFSDREERDKVKSLANLLSALWRSSEAYRRDRMAEYEEELC